jgi:dynein heavy chain
VFFISVQNGRSFILLGDKQVDYNSSFRMYFTTKVANPVFSSAVYAKTTVINYTLDVSVNIHIHEEYFPKMVEKKESLVCHGL